MYVVIADSPGRRAQASTFEREDDAFAHARTLDRWDPRVNVTIRYHAEVPLDNPALEPTPAPIPTSPPVMTREQVYVIAREQEGPYGTVTLDPTPNDYPEVEIINGRTCYNFNVHWADLPADVWHIVTYSDQGGCIAS